MKNIEIKASVKKLAELVAKTRQISKSEGTVIPQHDTFYNSPNGRLKLRKFQDGKAELIYYDRPDIEGPKLSTFEKCYIPAANVTGLQEVLEKALGVCGVVKKTRQLFMVDQTRVHIDEVENLGDFMELEVVLKEGQSEDEGQEIAYKLMNTLGIEKEDLLSCAYTDLLCNE